ncbi:MAG: SulP family inorganic anion transporter [Verrucomicrobiae bacterium]|nr:SulP family inorganic anion transporter [Verrucomicrobiae bacterium]
MKGESMGAGMWRSLWIAARERFARHDLQPLPLRGVLRDYARAQFAADARAAFNVAFVAFPQGMAYALIAGLPVWYGIYGGAVASVVGGCFGSSRHTILGPTNASAILALTAFAALPEGYSPERAVSLLCLMVGAVLLAGAFLRLASLTQYVSHSVLTGYVAGAAVLIIANQLHHVLGVTISRSASLIEVCLRTAKALPETNEFSLLFGGLALAIWLLCRRRFPRMPAVAVALAGCAAVAWGVRACGLEVRTLAPSSFGSWSFTVPRVDPELINLLSSSALAIAFVAVLECSLMARTLAHRSGDPVNGNQDMMSLGLANAACGWLGGMAASGSLTRSALNWTSGAVTPFASVLCGTLCAVGALFLGPLVGCVPLSALAMMVICIAGSLVHPRQIRVALRATKSDAAVFLTTFLAALLAPLDFAIFLGTGASLALFLRKVRSPALAEYTFDEEGQLRQLEDKAGRADPQISIVHVEGELFFGAAEVFQQQIRILAKDPEIRVVILRLKNARHLDATSVLALEDLARFLGETGRALLVSGVMRDAMRVLRNSGLIPIIGRQNIFVGSATNPNVSTRKALMRAQELLGGREASIRIFAEAPRGANEESMDDEGTNHR